MEDTQFRDVIIIGAGFAGVAALYHAREAGMDVLLLEAGSDVGGTWHWNSYPDVRTDTEAWYYSYSFAPEVVRKWRWKERFPSGPEVKGFIRFVVDELDLESSIAFNTRVSQLVYDEAENIWTITADDGSTWQSRFVITAVGGLSAPNIPTIPGMANFKGQTMVSSRWQPEAANFDGKRVGILGTGSTGVQLVTALAPKVRDLYVLQRTPNYVLPRNNYVISDEQWDGIVRTYDAIWSRVRHHYFGYPLELTGRSALDATEEERNALFEDMWRKGGFAIFLEAFDDLASNAEANKYASDFIRAKIRALVDDPATADLLAPSGYPFGGKRPVIGSGYFETFNRRNVHLIDLKKEPLTVDDDGLISAGGEKFELDVLIFATGFDAGTGAIAAIDVRGVGGETLAEAWADGTHTHLGICTAGFPNLLYVYGPQTPYANQPPSVEASSKWIIDLLSYMNKNGLVRVEGNPEAEVRWSQELNDAAAATVFTETADSARPWFMNTNVEGKRKEVAVYFGGLDRYQDFLDTISADGYQEFQLT
jgi:cation diffusion facilitator CzcD-associated flavoprotein CzcO